MKTPSAQPESNGRSVTGSPHNATTALTVSVRDRVTATAFDLVAKAKDALDLLRCPPAYAAGRWCPVASALAEVAP
jgi:hypothetical protein